QICKTVDSVGYPREPHEPASTPVLRTIHPVLHCRQEVTSVTAPACTSAPTRCRETQYTLPMSLVTRRLDSRARRPCAAAPTPESAPPLGWGEEIPGSSCRYAAALFWYRVFRRTRPGSAPVWCPSSSSTWPFTMVEWIPLASSRPRQPPAGKSCTVSSGNGLTVSGSKIVMSAASPG